MNKNLTLQMGNCPHRKYIPTLVDMVKNGAIDPTQVLPEQHEPLTDALAAYKEFDRRAPGWIKVELQPTSAVS
jgi:threonine dehydrogenase-like Zn-dependent dehydrogenase